MSNQIVLEVVKLL